MTKIPLNYNKKQELKLKKNNHRYNKLYSNILKSNHHYKKFIQFSTKKGKKNTAEKNFYKSLFHIGKQQDFFWKTLEDALSKTNVHLGVKVKRKGSQNIYVPIKINQNYKNFIAYNWILNDVKNGSKSKFHLNFVNEIIQTSQNKSNSIKKKNELYKLLKENMNNIWNG